ncbi:MAG: phosphatidylserine/phosphatidylglycerophosphate/cardiolipin synthase family protein [Oligoflexia bacterium]|nr:phosphatidylserine/phosphatidylglycerophosphate/cardiolipin synthase family protein [Oligoflexia bacterium]
MEKFFYFKLSIITFVIVAIANLANNVFAQLEHESDNGSNNGSDRSEKELTIPESNRPGAFPVIKLEGEVNLSDENQILPIDGNQSLFHRANSIKNAKKKIYIHTLYFNGDESGKVLSNLMMDKKINENLDVRVFIDPVTQYMGQVEKIDSQNTKIMFDNFMAAGIPVYGYECESIFMDRFLKQGIREFFSKKWFGSIIPAHGRNHEKVHFIDDDLAIIGGLNIVNYFFRVNEAGVNLSRDQDVLIKGKTLVKQIGQILDKNVQYYTSGIDDPTKKSCFNNYPFGSPEYIKFLKYHQKPFIKKEFSDPKEREKLLEVEKRIAENLEGVDQSFFNEKRDLNIPIKAVESTRLVYNNPAISNETNHIEDAYIGLINQAQKKIMITNSYFFPPDKVVEALRKAASRGVKIFIATKAAETNDISALGAYARKNYHKLVKGYEKQFKIYEWTGIRKGHEGEGIINGTLHAKLATFDDQISIIGSYNFDPASRNGNSEIAIIFKDEQYAKQLTSTFFEKDLEYSREISEEDILNYSLENINPLYKFISDII